MPMKNAIPIEQRVLNQYRIYRQSDYAYVMETLGTNEGTSFCLTKFKGCIQQAILTVGASCLVAVLSESAVLVLIGLFIGFAQVFYTIVLLAKNLKNIQERGVNRRTINGLRYLNLSLLSGAPLKESFIACLDRYAQEPTLHYVFSRAIVQLRQGASIEQVSEQVNSLLDHAFLKRLSLLLAKYESAGSAVILFQLNDLLDEAMRHQQDALKKRLEAGSLLSILPALLIFLNIMILLMSPIFLGGLAL